MSPLCNVVSAVSVCKGLPSCTSNISPWGVKREMGSYFSEGAKKGGVIREGELFERGELIGKIRYIFCDRLNYYEVQFRWAW